MARPQTQQGVLLAAPISRDAFWALLYAVSGDLFTRFLLSHRGELELQRPGRDVTEDEHARH